MQTFVKLMLRFTTNVTTSPAWRRRSSSAARVRAWSSRPRVSARTRPSATESSPPSSRRARMARTVRAAPSSAKWRLPASPVLIRFLHEAVVVHERAHPFPQRLRQELGAPRVLRIDRQPLAQGEAGGVGGVAELADERPRL